MKIPIFTRYLYFKTEVINSLHWSLLDHQYEESLFWAYEIYFSGFQDEIFCFLQEFYKRYQNEVYPEYEIHLSNLYEEWIANKKDHCIIGSIVNLIVNSKVSVTNSLRIRQNIQTNKPKVEKKSCEIQRLLPEEIHNYHTLKLTKDTRNWNFLDKVACKYHIRRVICSDLSIAIPIVDSFNFDDWLYYASFTPIWKQRILKFGGKIDDINHTTVIENEDFNSLYDYEPDEQSRELKQMLWCNDFGSSYENLSISTFCEKYGRDNVYRNVILLLSR